MKKAISTLLVGLMPAVATADTGEGLIEILFIQGLRLLNMFWPFILPLGLLGHARKKFSFYLYSLATCGMSAWLVVYCLPQLVLSWLDPELEFTVRNLRIALIYLLFSTFVAVALSVLLSRYIRDFNDSHD